MSYLQTVLRRRGRRLLGAAALWVMIGLLPAQSGAQSASPAFDIIRIGVEQGLSHRMVYDILEDQQGYMWFATREGLNRFDGHRFVVYTHEPGDSLSIPDSRVKRMFESADGTLWIGTVNGGLVRFDRSTETFSRVPSRPGDTPPLLSESVTDIAETPDGTLWVTTAMSRLFRLPPKASELELVSVTVAGKSGWMRGQRIGVDPSGGIILFCSPASGGAPFLGRLDPVTSECSMDGRLPGTSLLTAIGFESDGSAVVAATLQIASGSERTRVARWDGQLKWSVALDASGSRDLIVDDHDQIWLATHSGVFLLEPTGRVIAHFTRSPAGNKTLSDDRANAFAHSRDGSVWVATDDGVTVFVPVRTPFRASRHRPGDPTSLGDPRVNAILETSDGTLWVGTSAGLYQRQRGNEGFEPFVLPDVPGVISGTQERIWSLIEAAPGVIWIGTAAGGLYRLDTASGEIRHMLAAFHLIADRYGGDRPSIDRTSIPFIGRDLVGNLWLTTTHAVLRVDSLDVFTLVASRTADSPPVDKYVNVLLQDHRGDYWAGNDFGLEAFDADSGEFRAVGETGLRDRGLSFRSVWTIAESPLTPDAIWVGTIGGGLNRYDVITGHFTWYTMADGLPNNTIYGILVDDRGLLWLSTANGLARFDPRTGSVERFTLHDGLHDDDFDLLAYHKGQVSGKMWFGGPTGLTEFHPDSVALSTYDFKVLISSVIVLDRPHPGIVGEGDTLRLAHTQNTLGFRFSAPDLLHPNNVAFRYRLVGYDDDWRVNDASRAEASYTRLPPGWYTFEVQAAGPGGGISRQTTRLVVSIVPAFWQTGWFLFLGLTLATGMVGWGVSSVLRLRARRVLDIARREVELKRLLSDREEQERGRLAREIHDGPIQTLYSVNHRLEEASPEGLVASRRDVKKLASELRDICEHLRPALVTNLGLEGALRARVRTLSRQNPDLRVSLTFDPECSELDEPTAHACYRIVQEALNNVIHHADASQADVQISCDHAVCRLLITDDGRGFDLPKDWLMLASDSHYGLLGIRERAETQGGICRIDSARGKGTRIEVDFPRPSLQPAG
ncbi:MAG: signal transduction histidine kinase/ligand-binding sensor domain-containing protein [Rhodothermales bacterium]|jgi:signal transduction histidine kinase/ligand-binding sensor domain-containing protein